MNGILSSVPSAYLSLGLALCMYSLPLASKTVGPEDIIPRPVKTEVKEGTYVLPGNDFSSVRVQVGDRRFARELSSMSLEPYQKDELYRLTIDSYGVKIEALTEDGAYRGRQTLSYMKSLSDTLRHCTVLDYPRFRYRGIMLDISRNFRDKEYIMRQIDVLSKVKINYLHLHLTDDAGWRMQIDSYPRLTSVAAYRNGETWQDWSANGRTYEPATHGGFLTKDDIREILEYAEQRHMTIIPEIEMPGHSRELLVAYPQLACTEEDGTTRVITSDVCPGTEATFEVLEAILDEVIELFPSKYIHIGGDEASKGSWKKCPACHKRMEEEGLSSVEELQSYLIGRIARHVEDKGRSIIGWDEIMQGGLAKNATVLSWRGVTQGAEAMSLGHDVIMAPSAWCYLDYYQDAPMHQPLAIGGYNPLRRVYSFDPADGIPENDRAHLLGEQGNLWAEFIPTAEHNEYMLYPRAMAIAEGGWSPLERKDFEDFHRRIIPLTDWMTENGYHPFDVRKEYGDRPESYRRVQHLALGCPVTYRIPFSKKYHGGGQTALTDGKQGGWSYMESAWQGFNSDVDFTVDLGSVKPVHYVGAWFYSCLGNWIALPETTEIYLSTDGENFECASTLTCQIDETGRRDTFFSMFGSPLNAEARYVRVKCYRGTKPYHGFIFLDELVVN